MKVSIGGYAVDIAKLRGSELETIIGNAIKPMLGRVEYVIVDSFNGRKYVPSVSICKILEEPVRVKA